MVWLAIFQHNFSIYLCTFFQLMSPCLKTIEIELLILISRIQVKTANRTPSSELYVVHWIRSFDSGKRQKSLGTRFGLQGECNTS